MKYEVKKIKYVKPPLEDEDNNSTTFGVCIFSGIVGDEYEFYRKDSLDVTIIGDKTRDEFKADVTAECVAFVIATYPDTE